MIKRHTFFFEPGRGFPVLFDQKRGLFIPIEPRRLGEFHAAYGGESFRSGENIKGWIEGSSLVICPTYATEHGYPELVSGRVTGRSIVVPINRLTRSLTTRDWPVVLRLSDALWFLRTIDVSGVLRGRAAALNRVQTQSFRVTSIPRVGAPEISRSYQALVTGAFRRQRLRRLIEFLHLKELGFDTARYGSGLGRCEFWNRFGIFPFHDGLYVVRQGICRKRVPYAAVATLEGIQKELGISVVNYRSLKFRLKPEHVMPATVFVTPNVYLFRTLEGLFACAYTFVRGEIASTCENLSVARWAPSVLRRPEDLVKKLLTLARARREKETHVSLH